MSPRACTVCIHPEREDIDKALVEGIAFPALIAQYRVSKDALSRHKHNHLPKTLAKARDAEEVARADDCSQTCATSKFGHSPSSIRPRAQETYARRSGL